MTSKQPLKEPSKTTSGIIELIKNFWAPILSFIGVLIFGVQFLELWQTKQNLILDVVAFLLFGTTIFIFFYLTSQQQHLDNKKRVLFMVLMFVILISAFWVKGEVTRPIDYYILDASEFTGDLSPQVMAKLKLSLRIDSIPNNKDVGLAVFGGETRGVIGCNDIEELVTPSPKERSVSEINDVIDLLINFKPSGPGNIQGAILFALEKLKTSPGTPRIVLITSGIDERCGPLDRSALDKFAQENNMSFELVPYAVNMSEADKSVLQAYGTNNILISAESVDQIPAQIEIILNAPPASNDLYYFGYYGYVPESNK